MTNRGVMLMHSFVEFCHFSKLNGDGVQGTGRRHKILKLPASTTGVQVGG